MSDMLEQRIGALLREEAGSLALLVSPERVRKAYEARRRERVIRRVSMVGLAAAVALVAAGAAVMWPRTEPGVTPVPVETVGSPNPTATLETVPSPTPTPTAEPASPGPTETPPVSAPVVHPTLQSGSASLEGTWLCRFDWWDAANGENTDCGPNLRVPQGTVTVRAGGSLTFSLSGYRLAANPLTVALRTEVDRFGGEMPASATDRSPYAHTETSVTFKAPAKGDWVVAFRYQAESAAGVTIDGTALFHVIVVA